MLQMAKPIETKVPASMAIWAKEDTGTMLPAFAVSEKQWLCDSKAPKDLK